MGGINGHLDHPYDIAKDGKELIQMFEDAIEDISKKRSILKIDGISMSVRLNKDGKFVIDRGSNKDLDKKGVRQEDLEERFGAGHGLVKIGKTILDLFDSVQESITKELAALGITAGSGVILNFEFVDKKTNIINYSNQVLIVHGLKMEDITSEKRLFRDVELYNQLLLKNLFVAFNKYSKIFKMSGGIVVGGEKSNDIDISKVLDAPLTLNGTEKSLVVWLEETTIDLPMITREEYKMIDEGPKENLSNKELDDYIIYYATIKMGDVILKSLGLDKHEGLIVTGKNKFKITGSFIIKNLESPFALMKEEHFLGYTLWGIITPSGKVLYGGKDSSTHRQLFIQAYSVDKKITEKEFDEVLALYRFDPAKHKDKINYASEYFDLSVANSLKVGFVRFLIDPDDKTLVFETSARPKQKVLFAIGRVVDKAKKGYLAKAYDLEFKGNRSPGPMTYNDFIVSFDLGIDLKEEEQKIEEILSMEAYYDFWGWIIGNNVNIGKAMLENPNDFKGRLITPEMKFHSFKRESIPTGSVYIPIKADGESNNYYTHALFYSELDAPSIEELAYMREKNFMGYKKAWSEKSIRFYVEKANGNLFFQAARDIDSGVLLTGIRTIQSLYDKQPSSVLKTFPKFYRQPEKIIIDTPNIDIIVDYNQSSLSKIRNKIASLNEETNNNKQVVIIPGGFHPFHPGHLSLYQKAKKDFPDARVIFVATNKTVERPFEFTDKVFLANLLGIPKGDIILVNNPLDKKEMEELFPGKDLLFIRGQKEVRMKNMKTKYYPNIKFKVLGKALSSATQIRDLYTKSDEQNKKQILVDLYGSPILSKTKEIFSSAL